MRASEGGRLLSSTVLKTGPSEAVMTAALAPCYLADMDKDLVNILVYGLPSHFRDPARA